MKPLLFFWLLFLCTCSTALAQAANNRLKFHYRLRQRLLNELGDTSQANYPLFITRTTVVTTTTTPTTVTLNPSPVTSTDTFALCSNTKVLKVLVTPDNEAGELKIDPWSVLDYRVNDIAKDEIRAQKTAKDKAKLLAQYTDPCYNGVVAKKTMPGGLIIHRLHIINAATPVGLKIRLPARTKVGNPVVPVSLPYQAWIVGFNTIAFKTRPRVTDYKGTSYKPFLTSGNFNLGLSIGRSFGSTVFTRRTSTSYSATVGLNFGLSGTKLKDEPLTRLVDVASIPSSFVFSPAGTLILARNDIGLVLALGIDHMTGTASSAWAYQNKLFFGFGIQAGLKI